jgi:hypothetical protein
MKEKEDPENNSAEKLNLLIILNSECNPHINGGFWGLQFDTDELEKAYLNDRMEYRKDGMIAYCVVIFVLILSLIYGVAIHKDTVITNGLLIPFIILFVLAGKSCIYS